MRSKDLIGKLIGLARATEGNEHLIRESLFTLIRASLSQDIDDKELIKLCDEEKKYLVPDCFSCMCPCGRTSDYDIEELEEESGVGRDLRVIILNELFYQKSVDNNLLLKALYAVGANYWEKEELIPILRELTNGQIIVKPTIYQEIRRINSILEKEDFIISFPS